MGTFKHLIYAGLVLTSGLPYWVAGPALASQRVTQIDAAAIGGGARDRIFIECPRGDETKLLEIKDRLLSLGATRVNVFLPSVLACDVLDGADLGWLENDPDLACFRADDLPAQPAPNASRALTQVMEGYSLAERLVRAGDALEGAAEFQDRVLEVPREILDRSRRPASDDPTNRADSSVDEAADRDIGQNSEFLIGDVLLQLVLPESEGSGEDWTDEDLSQAIAGAYAGAMAYQQRFAFAPINFVVKVERRVPTVQEPIYSNLDTDDIWISDVMLRLGYRDPDSYLFAVHQYNNAGRRAYGTDWVYTAFIACSRNEETHRFRDSNYVAYAWGGGPHLVIPFPSSSYPQYDLTEREIFSMIFQHEMGHIFWALDEYPSSPSTCSSRSGYLDYPNRNKFSIDPGGGYHGCPDWDDLVPCTMMSAVQKTRPFCEYSTGQIGLADADGNSVPDVFDEPPLVEFEGSSSETLRTDDVTINMRARSTIVPNQNPAQDPDTRVSYGAPLMDSTARVNSTGAIALKPLDGKWNEMEEDLSFSLIRLRPGLTRFQVRVRNSMGAASEYFEKQIYRIGVDFVRLETLVRPGEILVKWTTAAEIFGAKFDLFRIAPGSEPPDTTLIATDVPPTGETNDVFRVFEYRDTDVVPGRSYRYIVTGKGAVELRGELIAFEETSGTMTATAMLPIASGTMASALSPNPFSAAVSVSLDVPKSYASSDDERTSSSFRREVRTPVEIVVYDALGRQVREVYRGEMYSRVATFQWDGKNSQGDPVPSGVYFIRATAGSVTEVRKAVVVR